MKKLQIKKVFIFLKEYGDAIFNFFLASFIPIALIFIFYYIWGFHQILLFPIGWLLLNIITIVFGILLEIRDKKRDKDAREDKEIF